MPDPNLPPDLEITDRVPSGLRVTGDTPYRFLLVTSLIGSADGASISGAPADGVAEVSPHTFDEFMASARPTVRLRLADPVGPGNALTEIELCFDSMNAFQPQSLVEQIPSARSLWSIRETIMHRLHGRCSEGEFRSKVQRAVEADADLTWLAEIIRKPVAPSPQRAQEVDSILDQLDLGDSADSTKPPPAKSGISSMVSAAAQQGSPISPEEAAVWRRTLVEIDRRISLWLAAVRRDPAVRSVEAAWRSLAFLISHMDFRKGLRLSVLHAAPGDRLERFRSRLIDPVFDEGLAAPDLILVDGMYGDSAPDVEALDEFAQHGASLPAVVLASVGPAFFGLKFAWQVATMPALRNVLDQWKFAKWNSLRQQEYARFLGVVFGRCLLREPYKIEPADASSFSYGEEVVGEGDLLWANGIIPAGLAIAQSVAERGWPTAISGVMCGQVEGFATTVGGKQGEKTFGPTDTTLPQEKIEEMAAVGLNAVVGLRDRTEAIFWNGLTAALPHKIDHAGLLEISLPYQLFAARLSSLLFALKPHLVGLSREKITASVHTHVTQWLGCSGNEECVTVQSRAAENQADATELAVTVTPPQSILPGAIPVVMGYRIP